MQVLLFPHTSHRGLQLPGGQERGGPRSGPSGGSATESAATVQFKPPQLTAWAILKGK